MNQKKGISVITVVYSEESRIESFIENFAWSDDVIIIDKTSPDKTIQIANSVGTSDRVKCFTVPYSENIPKEMNEIAATSKHEWLFMVTASDIIHPELVKQMLALINDPNFDADIIEYPFVNHVFGISSPKSPWSGAYRNRLFKKSISQFVDQVHTEVIFRSDKIHRMPFDSTHAVHHLTHTSLDSFFERHCRYAKLEVEKLKVFGPKVAIRKAFVSFVRSLIRVLIRKQTFLLGKDGIGLSMAYVSYSMFVFLYTWQHFYGNGQAKYQDIRNEYKNLWKRNRV